MAIYQTNIWICEVCGKQSVTVEEVSPYSDPVVAPPKGEEWEYVGEFPNELLACPECVKKGRRDF
jgi:ribosomal protein L37AE/L43A